MLSGQIAFGKAPVDQMVQVRPDVVSPAVLIVQIIGVLPDIQGQNGNQSPRYRGICVGCFDHFQRRVVLNQPCPSASELRQCGLQSGQ